MGNVILNDFRLLDVRLELLALEDFLAVIEKEMKSLKQSEESKLEATIEEENLSPDDPDWHEAHYACDEMVDFVLPRFFRGPFLVALYAVYEAAVTEIAGLIQAKKQQALSLDDIRGSFLDRAKKYFKDILQFELCSDNTAWERIKMLSELRNAIAHTNGRVKLLPEKAQERVRAWERKGIGIGTTVDDYIIVSSTFLQKTFEIVRSSLEDLVERYKTWDDNYRSP